MSTKYLHTVNSSSCACFVNVINTWTVTLSALYIAPILWLIHPTEKHELDQKYRPITPYIFPSDWTIIIIIIIIWHTCPLCSPRRDLNYHHRSGIRFGIRLLTALKLNPSNLEIWTSATWSWTWSNVQRRNSHISCMTSAGAGRWQTDDTCWQWLKANRFVGLPHSGGGGALDSAILKSAQLSPLKWSALHEIEQLVSAHLPHS